MQYLLGLVGHPVEHSLSPVMHKAALAHFDLSGDYRLIDLPPEKIERGVAELLQQGFAGFNVTIPHKQTFHQLSAELTEQARQLKAVNTVKITSEKKLVGHNTDLGGFTQAIEDDLRYATRGDIACVMGAGGAARAAVWGLVKLGWRRIQIVARKLESAQQLKDEVLIELKLSAHSKNLPDISVSTIDLSGLKRMPDFLLNCTPIGLTQEDIPDWAEELLRSTNPYGAFFDMVYSRNGKATPLIAHCRRLRLNCLDGSSMLVRQAALAFQFWTGHEVPLQVMSEALKLNQEKGTTDLKAASKIAAARQE